MSRAIERVLLAFGIVCLGWYGFVHVESLQARRAVEHAIASPRPAPAAHEDDLGEAVGMLEIPRIGLSSPVVIGDDDATLRATAGLLPDTARPWEHGNAAVAGHRDQHFALLRHIRTGDRIQLATPHGDFEYSVVKTSIVAPTDISVLEPGDTDSLTLITCHPFAYIGSAPNRFIVRANRVK